MKFKSNIEVQAGLEDASGSPGTVNQLLSSTVTGTAWVDQSTLVSGSAERVSILVKNGEGTALVKGDPVYIIGSVGASARLEVGLCDASDSSKMPCVGLLEQNLLNNGEGTAVTAGKLRNLVTTPIDGQTTTENDTIYVKAGGSSGSSLTTTKPTGSTNLIQNVGQVGRVSTSSDGNFVVSAIMRTNDVPNLPEGRIWIGDGNTIVSDTVYIDEPNNRVGIGETSPTSKLSIKGTQAAIDITRGTTGDSKWEFSSDSTAMYISEMSTGTRDYIMTLKETTGNVGIGTTSPSGSGWDESSTVLHLYKNSTSGGLLALESSNTKAIINAGNNQLAMFTTTGDPIRFGTNGSERMRINSDGNVGIGTTNPSAFGKFVVSGSGNLLNLNATSGKVYQAFYENGAGRFYLNTLDGTDGLAFTDADGVTERMRIDSNGNVGIGTDSPKGKLHVLNGTAGTYAPDSESDTLVVESATPGGISLIGTGAGSASKQSITFGTTSDTTSARIIYNSNSSFLSIGTTTASNFVKFVSGDGVTALTLDSLQNATFAGNVVPSTNPGGSLGLGSKQWGALHISSSAAITWGNGDAAITEGEVSNYSLSFKTYDGTNNSRALLLEGNNNATFTAQAFATVATSSGDASSTLTTKGYVDGLITGATIYRGAWDPSGGGYGSPDLSTVTQTSGYYYICSAAGTAEPNGTGTEPDTWETGDWVIYNDVSGTGQWQKIDNSSVLSGAGTGQTVALWEGAGSVTDSETLGNAPITVSGNNSTFAGNVTLSSTAPILHLDNTTATTGKNWRLSSAANGKMYIAQDGVVDAITLDHTSGNATFAGDVAISSTMPKLTFTDLQQDDWRIMNDNGDFRFTNIDGSGHALILATNNNATFAGAIGVGGTTPSNGYAIDITPSGGNIIRSTRGTSVFGSYQSNNSDVYLGTISNNTFKIITNDTVALTLDTSQSATFAGDVYIPEYIYHSGDANTYIRFTADTQTFRTGGDDRLILTNTTATFAGAVAVNGSYLTVANASNPYIYVNDTNAGSGIFQQEGNTTRIGSDSNTQVVLIQNNATAVTIDTSKNVGIGTTLPGTLHGVTYGTTKLHVDGGTDRGQMILEGDSLAGIIMSDNGATANERVFSTMVDGGNYQIKPLNDNGTSTAGGAAVTVLHNGNVGIGTTSPDSLLEISKAQASGPILKLKEPTVLNGTTEGGPGNNLGVLGFVSADTSTSQANLIRASVEGQPGEKPYGTGGLLTFNTMQTYTGSGTLTDLIERMRIDSSGNVGIGTTDPGANLQVYSTSNRDVFISGYGTQAQNTWQAQHAFFTSAGQGVVVGKANVGNDTNRLHILYNTSNGDAQYLGYDTSNNNKVKLNTNGNSHLNGGNVGIGTTSPSYKLDVNGGIQAGGKVTYTKSYSSLDTTGNAVAGLTTSTNGNSAVFTFTCCGHSGGYQKIVYSCYNSGGNWYASKVIDEGTNQLDVVASANSTTITFTFKSISGTMSYTPRVTVEAVGTTINSTYA